MSTENYESLYNDLKEEYEQSKKDNDEICKEYESTIQLLTDSVEAIKKEKKDLQTKLSKIENEQKTLKKEKDNLIKKNKDKNIDIQYLNEQNEKLNVLIKKLKDDKSLFDTKIVTFENDIDHYQNKIREYEDFIDELKAQLEDALEENITLQTEFETYKLNTGDQLIRKDEELRDIKNDNINKDKLIQRLTKSPSDRFNIPKVQEKLIKDRRIMRDKRRYTVNEQNKDFKFRNMRKHLTHIEENENENIKDNIENYNNRYGNINELNIIMEDSERSKKSKKTLIISKTSEKKLLLNENSNSNNTNNNSNLNLENNKSQIHVDKILNFNDDTETNENHESDIQKDDNSKEKEKEKNNSNIRLHKRMEGLTSIIKKQFGDLVICEENRIYINPLVTKILDKEQIKEFKITLRNMLIRVKQRINNFYTLKKSLNEKFEKIKNK